MIVLAPSISTKFTVTRGQVPLYKGENSSLVYRTPSDNYFGSDGFGDFPFPNPPPESLIQDKHSAIFLTEIVKEYPGEVTVICLGPLTNIALAIRLDRNFLSNVGDIFILGGSVRGVGNTKPGVEFNALQDPEGESVVLSRAEESGKQLYMIPIESSGDAFISGEWRRDVLGTIDTPIVQLLNQAEALHLNETQWQPPDSLTVALAIHPEITHTLSPQYIDIETRGFLTRGTTVVDYNRLTDKNKQVLLIEDIDVEAFKDLLIRSLSASSQIAK